MKKKKLPRGTTEYSETIEGTRGNYNWACRFDVTDGFVGITQFDGATVKARALLSPVQFKALCSFVKRYA